MYSSFLLAAVDHTSRIPLKLSEDDSFVTWTEVVIPLFAALASVSVAIVSVVIASQARNIAKGSETARMKSDFDRVKFEQQLRFDAALKNLYVGISQRIEALRAHDAGVNANMLNLGRGGPGVTVSPRPPISSMVALIAAARLDTRDSESLELLDSLATYADYVAQVGGPTPNPETRDEWQRRADGEVDAWEALLGDIDDWRHSGPDVRASILLRMKSVSR